MPDSKEIRVGIIGLDTSHAPAFAKLLNKPDNAEVEHCPVVAAYPHGSPDIESSVSRVPEYTAVFRELGVSIVDSIDALVEQVDAVLLETNDGRPHLKQVLPAVKAAKPVFIDKPIAGSLEDCLAIFEAAAHYQVPIFSSSSLRYTTSTQDLARGAFGSVLGCDTYGPCPLEQTHPDLFWYGIHGVETLFTIMGLGCQTVTRVSTEDTDMAVGTWDDGRLGSFRGIRSGKADYGGNAFTEDQIIALGPHEGYRPLVVQIVKFFRSGQVPVSREETVEIFAFMEAADESKRCGGVPVAIEDVLQKSRAKVEPMTFD